MRESPFRNMSTEEGGEFIWGVAAGESDAGQAALVHGRETTCERAEWLRERR